MSKLLRLLPILPHNPVEFFDRIRTIVEVKADQIFRKAHSYQTEEWDVAVGALSKALRTDLSAYLAEPQVQTLEAHVLEATTNIPAMAPFRISHNGDVALARLTYALCRATRPKVALETGTCYGVTTSFILLALQVNAQGTLYSIDLPPLSESGDRFVGFLIPEELKARWRLYRGVSRRVMPKLLSNLESIDFFLHDSLHTYGNITRECNLARRYLSERGLIMADDVDCNAAFQDWVNHAKPFFTTVIRELQKPSLFGVVLLATPRAQP